MCYKTRLCCFKLELHRNILHVWSRTKDHLYHGELRCEMKKGHPHFLRNTAIKLLKTFSLRCDDPWLRGDDDDRKTLVLRRSHLTLRRVPPEPTSEEMVYPNFWTLYKRKPEYYDITHARVSFPDYEIRFENCTSEALYFVMKRNEPIFYEGFAKWTVLKSFFHQWTRLERCMPTLVGKAIDAMFQRSKDITFQFIFPGPDENHAVWKMFTTCDRFDEHRELDIICEKYTPPPPAPSPKGNKNPAPVPSPPSPEEKRGNVTDSDDQSPPSHSPSETTNSRPSMVSSLIGRILNFLNPMSSRPSTAKPATPPPPSPTEVEEEEVKHQSEEEVPASVDDCAPVVKQVHQFLKEMESKYAANIREVQKKLDSILTRATPPQPEETAFLSSRVDQLQAVTVVIQDDVRQIQQTLRTSHDTEESISSLLLATHASLGRLQAAIDKSQHTLDRVLQMEQYAHVNPTNPSMGEIRRELRHLADRQNRILSHLEGQQPASDLPAHEAKYQRSPTESDPSPSAPPEKVAAPSAPCKFLKRSCVFAARFSVSTFVCLRSHFTLHSL